MHWSGKLSSATLLFLCCSLPAFAHTDAAGLAGGFTSGFTHPLMGWDHVTAMVAVGLWGCFSVVRPSGCCRWSFRW
ncbi:MAG: HupE/UreJ family protein [Thiolinea sp.]